MLELQEFRKVPDPVNPEYVVKCAYNGVPVVEFSVPAELYHTQPEPQFWAMVERQAATFAEVFGDRRENRRLDV